ncbi:MAG: (d)CMP kinase [Phycisphaerae bacterium]|nr:(d)CMP kinase [Phycisphaerae bacterium]
MPEALIARGRPLVSATPRPIVITIDGPAGTGKSSVARALARRLGLDFLDTGAMYRAAAAVVIEKGLPLADPRAIVAAVVAANIHFDWSDDPPSIIANGRRLGSRIREPDVTAIVSPVSAIPELRTHMVSRQREIARQHPRLVTEGRDQGSVVFPDAAVKLYLDADPTVRALRRAEQLRAAGSSVPLDQLLREMVERDRADAAKPTGAMVRPADAELVDTTSLTFEQVVDRLEDLVRARVERV